MSDEYQSKVFTVGKYVGIDQLERYDVFVAPSGALYEYGPNVMRVARGFATPGDHAAFVAHIRARRATPFPLTRKRQRTVRVCGIEMKVGG